MTLLSAISVQAGYGKRRVLFDASVQIEKGQVALVVGPNGSGKSTLLKAIYHQCDVGRADALHYKEMDLRKVSLQKAMRSGLAYTPQYRNVFDHLTVRENLVLTMVARGVSSSNDGLDALLGYIGELAPILGKPAGQLSGGQRQLLALAMGLCGRTELLLLDEPLASLDEHTIDRVSAIVQRYRLDHSVAFVIVEHRFSKLIGLADRCFGMRMGTTVVSLDSDDLRDSTKFETAMQQVFFS